MNKFFTYERLLRALYDEDYRRYLQEAHNLVSIITNIEQQEKQKAREYKSQRDVELNERRTRV